jgi:hypothetical protein
MHQYQYQSYIQYLNLHEHLNKYIQQYQLNCDNDENDGGGGGDDDDGFLGEKYVTDFLKQFYLQKKVNSHPNLIYHSI